MKKGFYMIATNNGIMEPEEGSFEHYYPLMVNRRADWNGWQHSWSVTHIQTGRSISTNLPLSVARRLARNIKDCKVWEVSLTFDDVHDYLASETQEKEFIMNERDKAQRGYR